MSIDTPIRPGTDFGILRELPRWVGWRSEKRKDKLTKVPYMPGTGKNASSTAHPNLVALDLDKAVDRDTGSLRPWAAEIINACNSYVEISPSGAGAHVWGIADNLPGENFVVSKGPDGQKVEVYVHHGRYLTVTDQPLGEARPLADISHVIRALKAERHRGNGSVGAGRASEEVSLDELPDEVVALVVNGAEPGSRSEQLFHVVATMRRAGWQRHRIIAALHAYPAGIAAKCFDNNSDEVARHVHLILHKIDDELAASRATARANGNCDHGSQLLRMESRSVDSRPLPPRDWTVEGRFLRRNVSLLSGEGGVGKSLLMLQLGAAHVLGHDWLRSLPVKGRAMIINCEEEEEEIIRRLRPILDHYGASFAEVDVSHNKGPA